MTTRTFVIVCAVVVALLVAVVYMHRPRGRSARLPQTLHRIP